MHNEFVLGTNDDFKPLIEYLDHRKYTMIAWDPPGCGLSRPPDIDYSLAYLHHEADCAIALMEVSGHINNFCPLVFNIKKKIR